MPKIPERVRLDPDAVLRCPFCGGAYLHQRNVDILEQQGNAPTGVHVLFACEFCEREPLLEVIQQRGMTIVHWQGHNY